MNDFFRKPRLIVALVMALLFLAVVVARFALLAFSPAPRFSPRSKMEERGSIVDRAGKPLAVQTNFYHVGVSAQKIDGDDLQKFSMDFSIPLEMEAGEISAIVEDARKDGKSFVYLKKKITQAARDDIAGIIESKKYSFVRLDKIPGRVYPEHSLASQLVGFMGDDGKGLSGIEYSAQDILAPSASSSGAKIDPGKNIYLTIDAALQYKLEEISREAMESTKAESMMLVAAEVKSGEILSYVSLPSADLNEYSSASPEEKTDRIAMDAYEPGSVFKIFTVAILRDEGKISGGDSFFCDGVYRFRPRGGETIKIKCLERHGWLTPRDALRFSCNDALGQMSERIGEDEFVARIRRLGFGARTGVELPGESAGQVKDTNSRLWSARSKPTIAIGQEISVSALQMTAAAMTIANGGVPVQLTVIKRVTNKDGSTEYEHKPRLKERALKKSAADYVLSCMETTATAGTGARANLGDISIGVKTGTAQMADKEKGGYSDTDFLSNCVAIFPVEDPQIALYIVIEKAKGETYAGRIVAPVIAKAADAIIDHIGMGRGGAASLLHDGRVTIPAARKITIGDTVPDFTGISKRDLLPILERDDIKIQVNGNGWVTSQKPAPGTPLSENMTIELNLE